MENPSNVLQQIVNSQGKELNKYQLNSPDIEYTAPYIEHWVLQLHGVSPDKLDDTDRLVTLLNRSVKELGLTRVSDHSHYFGPGVSTVIILAESHLSAHTWPELGYMHVDAVTCVKKLNQTNLQQVFSRLFQPKRLQMDQLEY